MRTGTDRLRQAALSVVGIVSVACASGPQLATAPPTLLIRIEHRPNPTTALMIWAIPAEGERLRLGMLTSGTSNLVRFDRVHSTTQYRFVAERRGGASITSPPFTPGRIDLVAWDLSANTLMPIETVRP